ncbi:hypothetical protein BC936DRAFT_144864, partial [Jimgerdemannia flammicorona]
QAPRPRPAVRPDGRGCLFRHKRRRLRYHILGDPGRGRRQSEADGGLDVRTIRQLGGVRDQGTRAEPGSRRRAQRCDRSRPRIRDPQNLATAIPTGGHRRGDAVGREEAKGHGVECWGKKGREG